MPIEALAAGLSLRPERRAPDDAILVTARVFAVADGTDLGRGAGRAALAHLRRLLGPHPTARSLARALNAVNLVLWVDDDGSGAMRSTMTAAVLTGQRLAVGHVGDSRAYLVRNGRVYCLTSDQSWPAPAETEPVRRLGHGPAVAPHLRRYLVDDGDRLVLCTDGVWRRLTDNDLSLAATLAPDLACEVLCHKSVAEGDEDASVVVVAFSQASSSSAQDGPWAQG